MVIPKKHSLETCHEAVVMQFFAPNSTFPKKVVGRQEMHLSYEMAGKGLAASLS